MKKPISSLKRKGIIMENKIKSNPWKKHKEDLKKFNENEMKRYKNEPFKFELGESVLIVGYGHEQQLGKVIKHNLKSYSVENKHGNKYRIDKISNTGMPNWTYETGVTGRMKIGANVKIKKYEELTEESSNEK